LLHSLVIFQSSSPDFAVSPKAEATTQQDPKSLKQSIMGLLKGIPPLLSADLLHVLRSMGHGDVLCIADANFPAIEVSTKTTTGKCIVTSCNMPELLDAICTVLPLDFFTDHPARSMAPAQGHSMPLEGAQALSDMQSAISKHSPEVQLVPVNRFEFYEHAKRSFAVVRSCMLLSWF
jgi:L-fucose mutarotase